MDSFVFEGEETPLLLRKRVLAGIVAAFLLIVAAYFVAAQVFGLSLEIDAEPFQDWVDGLGVWGPIAYMGILAISVLFAPIPNAPIFIAAGLAWGPVLGTIYSLAGMMLGSVAAFWVSRRFGRKYLPLLIGSKAAARIDSLSETMGGKVIFWARMLPVVNFDWVSFVAGLTAMRFWTYFTWSFFGMILPTSVAVVAGDGLGKDIRVTLALGGFWVAGILLSALYFWYRHRSYRNGLRREREAEAVAEQGEIGAE
jgi:uncharacterized membrane protein YdjX (TVP38/TMEM64 family)